MMGWLRRRFWKTPAGFFTPFNRNGDPAMTDQRRHDLYVRLFSTADGRAVMADQLALAGVGWPDFEPGRDTLEGAYRSGAKRHALSLATWAGLDTGALGRALIVGKLEAMNHATETVHDADAGAAAADD